MLLQLAKITNLLIIIMPCPEWVRDGVGIVFAAVIKGMVIKFSLEMDVIATLILIILINISIQLVLKIEKLFFACIILIKNFMTINWKILINKMYYYVFHVSSLSNVLFFWKENRQIAKVKWEVNPLISQKQVQLFNDIIMQVGIYQKQRDKIFRDHDHQIPDLRFHNNLINECANMRKLTDGQRMLIDKNQDVNLDIDFFLMVNECNERQNRILKNILDILDNEPNWLQHNSVMQAYFKATLNSLQIIHDNYIASELIQVYEALKINKESLQIHNTDWTLILNDFESNKFYLLLSTWYYRLYELMPYNFFLITLVCTISFILIILFFLFRFIFKIISKNWKKKISTKIQLKKKTQKFFIKQKKK